MNWAASAMSARDRILTAVRRGLGNRPPRPPAAIAAEAAALLDDPDSTRPAQPDAPQEDVKP